MSVSAIGTITDKAFRLAGIYEPGRVCPRRIRHSFVTSLSDAGCTTTELQNLAFSMGHTRSTARKNYTVGVAVYSILSTRSTLDRVSGQRPTIPADSCELDNI